MACRSSRLPARFLAKRNLAVLDSSRVSRSFLELHGREIPARQLSCTTCLRMANSSDSQSGGSRILNKVAHSVLNPREYIKIPMIEQLYGACSKPGLYSISEELRKEDKVPKTAEGEEIGTAEGQWVKEFNLPPTFSTWAQVTMLHMYLIVVRMRCFERDEYRKIEHQFVDNFFFDCERMMHVNHGITSSAMRQRYLKDLFVRWRGIMLACDEGILKGDAVLASAVWRNLYKAREDVDMRHLAAIVSWMRYYMKVLEAMEDDEFLMCGRSIFKWSATNEFLLVDKPTAPLAKDIAK